jgi:hypothetical protein
MEEFDPTRYGPEVARVLALDGNGQRLIPLTCSQRASDYAHRMIKTINADDLFPEAVNPSAPMAGLWLYFSCFEEAHELVSESSNVDCELWHAVLHRQEPDSGNAAYWFRKVGPHSTFSDLSHAAVRILHQYPEAEFRVGRWDPFAFVTFCERARTQPGSQSEKAALEIQRAEWQILFDHCARRLT